MVGRLQQRVDLVENRGDRLRVPHHTARRLVCLERLPFLIDDERPVLARVCSEDSARTEAGVNHSVAHLVYEGE